MVHFAYSLYDLATVLLLTVLLYNIFRFPVIAYKYSIIPLFFKKIISNFYYALFLENAYSVALICVVLLYKSPKIFPEIKKVCLILPHNAIYLRRATVLSFLIISLNILICFFYRARIHNISHDIWWIKKVVSSPSYTFIWIFSLCIISVFAEEIVFRWISFRTLEKRFNAKIAFFVSVMLWAAIHPLHFYLHYLVAGMLLQYFYKKSNSLLPSFIIHSAMNLGWILMNVSIVL